MLSNEQGKGRPQDGFLSSRARGRYGAQASVSRALDCDQSVVERSGGGTRRLDNIALEQPTKSGDIAAKLLTSVTISFLDDPALLLLAQIVRHH